MDSESKTIAAEYARTLPVTPRYIWENVRDWEHLPHLHRTSFRSIECVGEGDWGWRARIGLPPADSDLETLVELRLELPKLRYVAETLEGPGKGTEIWTYLEPLDQARTRIRVEFCMQGVSGAQADALGAVYVALYTRLWDEDEAMMVRRQELLARDWADSSGPVVSLGRLDEVRQRLPFQVEFQGKPFRVLEHEGVLRVHSALCPHLLGPLDDPPTDGVLTCPWHDYRFDVVSQRSCDGRGFRLLPAPRIEIDAETGQVRLLEPVS